MHNKLIPALRQFRHNDTDSFVSAYDMAIVDREFSALENQIVEEAAALCERVAQCGMSAAECASAVRFLKVSVPTVLPVPPAQKISGQMFYEAMYKADGGKWVAVDDRHKLIWEQKAGELNTLLNAPAAQEVPAAPTLRLCPTPEELQAYIAAAPEVPAQHERLLKIISYAYQIAGAHDAPEHILDVLSDPDAATAEQIEAMLPYQPEVPAPAAIPDVLFDGMAVYAEITRKLGKAHCHSHQAVSATLDAVVRLLRASQPTSAEELQQSEHIPPSRAEPAMQHLPPLPNALEEIRGKFRGEFDYVQAGNDYYNAVQMRQYGIACVTEASRFRAQGGNTNHSTGLPTSAEGKDSERLEGGV